MDIIAGETNFRNSKVVNFLVNKFSINFTSFYYSLYIISYM
ncbi:putative membrane protein [Clostridioides difficile P20]|nr:putative membrane protein [Clostridioides difficile P20]